MLRAIILKAQLFQNESKNTKVSYHCGQSESEIYDVCDIDFYNIIDTILNVFGVDSVFNKTVQTFTVAGDECKQNYTPTVCSQIIANYKIDKVQCNFDVTLRG
jgi:hypothetical protein